MENGAVASLVLMKNISSPGSRVANHAGKRVVTALPMTSSTVTLRAILPSASQSREVLGIYSIGYCVFFAKDYLTRFSIVADYRPLFHIAVITTNLISVTHSRHASAGKQLVDIIRIMHQFVYSQRLLSIVGNDC